MGPGPPDTREKAMAALRAAMDGDGSGSGSGSGADAAGAEGSAGAGAAGAGAGASAAVVAAAAGRHGATPALFKLQAYFAAGLPREDPARGYERVPEVARTKMAARKETGRERVEGGCGPED